MKKILRRNIKLSYILFLFFSSIFLIFIDVLLYKIVFYIFDGWGFVGFIYYFLLLYIINVKIIKKLNKKIYMPVFNSYFDAKKKYLKSFELSPIIKEYEYQLSIIKSARTIEKIRLGLAIFNFYKDGYNENNYNRFKNINRDLLNSKNQKKFDLNFIMLLLEKGNIVQAKIIAEKYDMNNNKHSIENFTKMLVSLFDENCCDTDAKKYFIDYSSEIYEKDIFVCVINYYLACYYLKVNDINSACIHLSKNVRNKNESFFSKESQRLFYAFLNPSKNNRSINYDIKYLNKLYSLINNLVDNNTAFELSEIAEVYGTYLGEFLLQNGYEKYGIKWSDKTKETILKNDSGFELSTGDIIINLFNKRKKISFDDLKENFELSLNKIISNDYNKDEIISSDFKITLRIYDKYRLINSNFFKIIFIIMSSMIFLLYLYSFIEQIFTIDCLIVVQLISMLLIYIILRIIHFIISVIKYRKCTNRCFNVVFCDDYIIKNDGKTINNIKYNDLKAIKTKKYIYLIINKFDFIPVNKNNNIIYNFIKNMEM